jgi:hypothetical protein
MFNTNFNSTFYPTGMQSYNNTLNQGGYKTWKGRGINQNPTGVAPGHIRPLTNKDPGNVFPSPFGKARPLKQYRKGRRISAAWEPDAEIFDSSTKTIENAEKDQILYNVHRLVRSSLGTPLGQGRNGGGLLSELMDKPGAYAISTEKERISEAEFRASDVLLSESEFESETDPDLQTSQSKENEGTKVAENSLCTGVNVVSSYYPNLFYLTENPEPNVANKKFCCNEERKARRRVVYANTNLPVNYYTTHAQYMQNRCQTFEQKSFNFLPASEEQKLANMYYANCQPNGEIMAAAETDLLLTVAEVFLSSGQISDAEYARLKTCASIETAYEYLETLDASTVLKEKLALFLYYQSIGLGVEVYGKYFPFTRVNQKTCKLTVYKPSNAQFAVQGAVSSSTKNLQLDVSTIQSNAASFRFNNNVFLKNKEAKCNQPVVCPFQNKKSCSYPRLPLYSLSKSQPSPYRYFYSPIYSTNHFAQSPKVGLYLNSNTKSLSL